MKRLTNFLKKDRKWLQKVKDYPVNTNYDITTDKMNMLAKLFDNSMLDAFNTIFRIGYIAGQKALLSEQFGYITGKNKTDETTSICHDTDSIQNLVSRWIQIVSKNEGENNERGTDTSE